MPGVNHRRSQVAHKSTGGTFQSVPEPVDPVDNLRNLSEELTFMTVAPRYSVADGRDYHPGPS